MKRPSTAWRSIGYGDMRRENCKQPHNVSISCVGVS
jgi:hypothetical protein